MSMCGDFGDWVVGLMRSEGTEAVVGPVQGTPTEEAFSTGQAKTYAVTPPADPLIGLIFEVDRTASLQAIEAQPGAAPCVTLMIEISLDGGVTWQHLRSAEVHGGALTRDGARVGQSGISAIGWGGVVPTHTRCRAIPARNFRTTAKIRHITPDPEKNTPPEPA